MISKKYKDILKRSLISFKDILFRYTSQIWGWDIHFKYHSKILERHFKMISKVMHLKYPNDIPIKILFKDISDEYPNNVFKKRFRFLEKSLAQKISKNRLDNWSFISTISNKGYTSHVLMQVAALGSGLALMTRYMLTVSQLQRWCLRRPAISLNCQLMSTCVNPSQVLQSLVIKFEFCVQCAQRFALWNEMRSQACDSWATWVWALCFFTHNIS